MVPFIAARAAPIAPLGSPNASKLHSTRPRCWTHLPKQAVQVTAGFLQGRAFCRNARAEPLCVIQSTCTRAGRGTYACERACWLAEPGRPGGKQWGFGAANPPESRINPGSPSCFACRHQPPDTRSVVLNAISMYSGAQQAQAFRSRNAAACLFPEAESALRGVLLP